MKTLIAFILAVATPALTYMVHTQDYTLQAIYKVKVSSSTNVNQEFGGFENISSHRGQHENSPGLGKEVALLGNSGHITII